MTQDQVMAMLRQVLPIIGGIAITLGWVTTDQVAHWTAIMLQIAGPIFVLGSVVWAMFANNKTSIVQSVAAMPETKVTETTSGKVMIEVTDPNLAAKAVEAQDKASGIS